MSKAGVAHSVKGDIQCDGGLRITGNTVTVSKGYLFTVHRRTGSRPGLAFISALCANLSRGSLRAVLDLRTKEFLRRLVSAIAARWRAAAKSGGRGCRALMQRLNTEYCQFPCQWQDVDARADWPIGRAFGRPGRQPAGRPVGGGQPGSGEAAAALPGVWTVKHESEAELVGGSQSLDAGAPPVERTLGKVQPQPQPQQQQRWQNQQYQQQQQRWQSQQYQQQQQQWQNQQYQQQQQQWHNQQHRQQQQQWREQQHQRWQQPPAAGVPVPDMVHHIKPDPDLFDQRDGHLDGDAYGSAALALNVKVELPDDTEMEEQGAANHQLPVPFVKVETEPSAEAESGWGWSCCAFCGHQCRRPADMTLHMKCRHPDAIRSGQYRINETGAPPPPAAAGGGLQCDLCGECFRSEGGLIVHSWSHLPAGGAGHERRTEAQMAAARAAASAAAEKRASVARRRYGCGVCDAAFVSEQGLDRHRATHFKCAVCGTAFRTEEVRDAHEESHPASKRFRCSQCPAGFRTKRGRMIHMRMHSAKRLVCAVCGKGFRRKADRKRHMLSHPENRAVGCCVCRRRFERKSSLLIHFRAKHEGLRRRKAEEPETAGAVGVRGVKVEDSAMQGQDPLAVSGGDVKVEYRGQTVQGQGSLSVGSGAVSDRSCRLQERNARDLTGRSAPKTCQARSRHTTECHEVVGGIETEEAKYRKLMTEPHRQLGVKPCDLPPRQLPTGGQIVGRIMKVRLEKMGTLGTGVNHVPVKPIIRQVAAEVVEVWSRSSVPSARVDRVVRKVTELWSKKDKVKKTRADLSCQIAAEMNALFDISLAHVPPEQVLQALDSCSDRPAIGRATMERWRRREEQRQRAASAPAAARSPAAAADPDSDDCSWAARPGPSSADAELGSSHEAAGAGASSAAAAGPDTAGAAAGAGSSSVDTDGRPRRRSKKPAAVAATSCDSDGEAAGSSASPCPSDADINPKSDRDDPDWPLPRQLRRCALDSRAAEAIDAAVAGS